MKVETILDRLLISHSNLPMCLPIIVMKRPSTSFKNEPSKSLKNKIPCTFLFLLPILTGDKTVSKSGALLQWFLTCAKV